MKEKFQRELEDYPQLKDSYAEEKGKCDRLQKAYEEGQIKIEEMTRRIEDLQEAERKYTDDYNSLVKKYEEQRTTITKMYDA